MFFRLFIFLLLNLPFTTFAQKGYEKRKNVEQYYHFQNKAELAIVDSDYSAAIAFYKTAFSFKKPDPRALYNCFRLGLMMKDTAIAKSCIEDLVVNGFPAEHLDNWLSGTDLLHSEIFKLVTKNLDSLHTVFVHSNKALLQEKLIAIEKKDQGIRSNTFTNEDLLKTDQENTDSLIAFSKKHGFPNYDVVGFEDLGGGGTYGIVYWHLRSWPISAIDSLGLKAVMEGNYPPDEFIMAYDFKSSTSKYNMLIPDLSIMDKASKHLPIDSVNKFRAAIYLESVADYRRKLLFMHQQKPKWFSFILAPQFMYTMNFASVSKTK